MSKPYTWNDIESILLKELKKTKHILVYGVFGSCRVESDIDTIILKKSESKVEEFYKDIHDLFERINKIVERKYNAKLICFNSFKEESLFMSKYQKKDLVFQILAYNTMSQIKRDWLPYLNNEKEFNKFLKGEINCLIGDKKDIFSKKFKKKSKHDSMYLTVSEHDRIYSNYPEKLELSIMNAYLDYMIRKLMNLPFTPGKNRKELKKKFYEMCSHLND